MSSKKRKNKNIHAGSNFDDFLKEEGIFKHCQEVGAKYAFVMQLQDEMENALQQNELLNIYAIYGIFKLKHYLEYAWTWLTNEGFSGLDQV